MNINYKNNNNENLFDNFEAIELLNLEDPQNYIPIYNLFFALNENNYNSINLNNNNNIVSLIEKINENLFLCNIKDISDNIEKKKVFFKLSGIMDPYKYISGKYINLNINNLPKFNSDLSNQKINLPYNSSYVDSFFSFLSSKLLNDMNFIHGIDFYGSFIGYKNNFNIDIYDEVESFSTNDYFCNNLNKIFNFINSDYEKLMFNDSRKNKKALNINNNYIELKDFTNLDINDNTLNNNSKNNSNLEYELVYKDDNIISNTNNQNKNSNKNLTSSSCSSRSSITDNENSEEDSEEDSGEDSEEDSEEDSDEDSEEEKIIISINKFPIQVICLEQCENTLDYLFVNDLIKDEELGCIIVQILMILITYQKIFNFTHNDLHTNNIMYIPTDKNYLYYKIDNKHYKIKTFGKIFKIIDFGRSIYKIKNKCIYNDSFNIDGDAHTQYNYPPFYNKNRKLVEPNFSFDLCRLGCSIYDYLNSENDHLKNIKSSIHKIIINWCYDDNKKNILYKDNGEERYPDFKLYKMISRKVNNHIPKNELLNNSYFDKFIVPKKQIKKNSNIWNIDVLNEL